MYFRPCRLRIPCQVDSDADLWEILDDNFHRDASRFRLECVGTYLAQMPAGHLRCDFSGQIVSHLKIVHMGAWSPSRTLVWSRSVARPTTRAMSEYQIGRGRISKLTPSCA